MALARITVLLLAALALQTPLSASAATLDDAGAYWGQTRPGAVVIFDDAMMQAYTTAAGPALGVADLGGHSIWVGTGYWLSDAACQRRILFHEYGHLLGVTDNAIDPRDPEDVMASPSTCGPPPLSDTAAVAASVAREAAVNAWLNYDGVKHRREQIIAARARCVRLRHSGCRARFIPGPVTARPAVPRP